MSSAWQPALSSLDNRMASTLLTAKKLPGWLRRLERGVYLLIQLEAGPARAWTENGIIIAQYLVDPAVIAYWSAIHYWI
jgi:predicted transcriptional regulator of viral defense system